ncbi:MAG: hypothetical protein U0736_10750 [Gemmataceae bacterium]
MRYRVGLFLSLLCSLVLLLPAGMESRVLQALGDLPDAVVAADPPLTSPVVPPSDDAAGPCVEATEGDPAARIVRQVAARPVKRSLSAAGLDGALPRGLATPLLPPIPTPTAPAFPLRSSALHVLHCVWRC